MENLKGLVIDNLEKLRNISTDEQQMDITLKEDSSAVRRILSFMEEKDWGEAERIADRIEEKEGQNARYWIVRLMCAYKVMSEEELAKLNEDFSDHPFYINALQVADDLYMETVKKISKNRSSFGVRERIYQLWNQRKEDLNDSESEFLNTEMYRKLAYKVKCSSNEHISYDFMAEYYILAGDLDYASYCYSAMVKENAQKALERFEVLREIIENGVRDGRKNYRYFKGILKQAERKYEEAARYFIESYNDGETISANGMAMLYCFDGFGDLCPHDAKKARTYFEEAYNYRPDPFTAYQYALVWLSVIDDEEYGVDNTYDLEKVEELFQKSFWWHDDGKAEKCCGDIYKYYKKWEPVNFKTAMAYYKAAVEKNNFDAMEEWILGMSSKEEMTSDMNNKDNWVFTKQCCEKLFRRQRKFFVKRQMQAIIIQ